MKRELAKPNDDKWTDGKQRCWDLLVEWVGAEHRMQQVTHHGAGLRSVYWNGIATFDGDELTQLALLAHKHLCRVEIASAGPSKIAIGVHPREQTGDLYSRHPGLSDLAEMCARMIQ